MWISGDQVRVGVPERGHSQVPGQSHVFLLTEKNKLTAPVRTHPHYDNYDDNNIKLELWCDGLYGQPDGT